MVGRTPDKPKGRIIDITSRLPILTSAQENVVQHNQSSENVVQITQKGVQDMMTWNEERESKNLEIILQGLYIELDKEIKILDQYYAQLVNIPTNLSAWENNNNQIFTTISSIHGKNGGIYSETDSRLTTTGDNILTQGFFQEKYNNSMEKKAIFTIKTSQGVKIKEIEEDGTPEIARMDYLGMNKFTIKFIHQKWHQPPKMQIVIHMDLYNKDSQIQNSLKQTKISEKKIIELCYREAIRTIQIFTNQFKLYE